MSVGELLSETAYLGYVVGAIFVILGVSTLVGLVFGRLGKGDDDAFQPIGDATPPAPRRSPFASGATNGGTTSGCSAVVPSRAMHTGGDYRDK